MGWRRANGMSHVLWRYAYHEHGRAYGGLAVQAVSRAPAYGQAKIKVQGVSRGRAAPALGAGETAARPLLGGGRKDPVLFAACLGLAVAIRGSLFV